MTTFVDDDPGYLEWAAAHPDGYVVNCGRTPGPDYLKLHRASCNFIRSSKRSNWTTGDYIKVCSVDLGDLRRWASGEVGGDLQPCQSCSPAPVKGNLPIKKGVRGGTGTGGGPSRLGTTKNVVEFLAALMAVIGGIVAFIQWLK
ncbi:hypothetical protein [Paludisphaera soli]|uniref:hypothetical protein n=1 Tax=Paludisphaera soli TaxID=2712865 RepID=UPI0013ED78C1|nr:hypothetical protein [Paludisphaera soli]